jgi:uncharacterized protein YceK
MDQRSNPRVKTATNTTRASTKDFNFFLTFAALVMAAHPKPNSPAGFHRWVSQVLCQDGTFMNRYLVLLAVASLGGCTTILTHPTKSTEEFYADYSACEAQAGQAAGSQDPYGVRRNRVLENCMRGKGWKRQEQ